MELFWIPWRWHKENLKDEKGKEGGREAEEY